MTPAGSGGVVRKIAGFLVSSLSPPEWAKDNLSKIGKAPRRMGRLIRAGFWKTRDQAFRLAVFRSRIGVATRSISGLFPPEVPLVLAPVRI